MDFIFKEVKKITITLLIMDISIFLIMVIFGNIVLEVVYGLIYGFIFTELTFILLGTIVERALSMQEKRAKRFMRINYVIRYFLTAVIIAIPFISPKINGWVVVLSLLAPKITYFAIGFFSLIPKNKGGK